MRCMIYLNRTGNLALAVPRFGSLLHSPNHLYLRMPRHIVPKIKKKCNIFLLAFCGLQWQCVGFSEIRVLYRYRDSDAGCNCIGRFFHAETVLKPLPFFFKPDGCDIRACKFSQLSKGVIDIHAPRLQTMIDLLIQ